MGLLRRFFQFISSPFRPKPLYFIEIRFMDPFRRYYKGFMRRAWHAAGIRTTKRPIPHITLISPFNSSEERKVISAFESACRKHSDYHHVSLRKPGVFPENYVVFIDAMISPALQELQKELYHQLSELVTLQPYDKNYRPHLTVWYRMTPYQYKRMKDYVFSQRELPHYSGNNIRITLLRNGRILREYDARTGKFMDREESLRTS